MLESITVRGFKSIRKLEGFELRQLNVLIGANGAGKSNLISLFDMLAAIVRKRLGVFVAEHGGPDALMFGGRWCTPHIDVELVFGKNGYEFSLHPGPRDRLFFLDEATRFFGEWSSPRRQLGVGHDEALLPDVTDEVRTHLPGMRTERSEVVMSITLTTRACALQCVNSMLSVTT